MFESEFDPYKLSIVGDNADETYGTKTVHAKIELTAPNSITLVIGDTAQWGVYKFEGDKLVVTWAVGKNVEPNESKSATFVLERAKE